MVSIGDVYKYIGGEPKLKGSYFKIIYMEHFKDGYPDVVTLEQTRCEKNSRQLIRCSSFGFIGNFMKTGRITTMETE